MRLSLGYSDSEDRVWLRIEGSASTWWLTRRITLGLLRKWAGMVERSYAADGLDVTDEASARSGAGARARSGHRSAVAAAQRVDPVGRPPEGATVVSRIVTSIDLSVNKGRFTLAFKGAGAQDRLRLSREEAHRMLDGLLARCRRNGWLDAEMPEWLRPAPEGSPGLPDAGPGTAGQGTPGTGTPGTGTPGTGTPGAGDAGAQPPGAARS